MERPVDQSQNSSFVRSGYSKDREQIEESVGPATGWYCTDEVV